MAPTQTPIIDSADKFVYHPKREEPMKLRTQCTLGTGSKERADEMNVGNASFPVPNLLRKRKLAEPGASKPSTYPARKISFSPTQATLKGQSVVPRSSFLF